MGGRSRELLLLLAACALALSEPLNKNTKKDKDADNLLFQYDDYDAANDQEVLFSEDRPCPRDCICTVTQGYKIAKCNRLEVGTQKFGDDITDLVIENADPSLPIRLDDFIFKKLGLHQIATVKIVNSTISYIGQNAFHGLHELYGVTFSNNNLRSIHPETFANNKKLLLLTLSYNPLRFPAPGSGDHFLNASYVQELDISYCNMQYVTASTFKLMPGLMYLNVAGNSLSVMDQDTFKLLPDLEELDLSDNNLSLLPKDIFTENTELATLHIQRNPINTVYDLQVPDLLTLNAGQTNIKFVGPSMFNGMTYIANLNLSGNNIEKIHNQAFHKLVELNYLDLSYNDLDLMSSILINNNVELDIFKISNNPRIKHLPSEGFNCSAGTFNIYLFDASNCGLEEIYDNSLSTFTALSELILSGNKLTTISNKVLTYSPKLVKLDLSYNFLTTLDSKIFEQNKELGKLNLRGNPLTILSADVFIHTPALTSLDMSHAHLTTLWKLEKNHPATLLSNLSFLNVSNNRITEIKQTELDNLNKLRSLDISNNPLACSRDFENLMSWLSKRKVSPNTNLMNIANLAKDAKEDEGNYSWEFLTRKTCGTALPHPVEPLPVSDEEIWEKIDTETAGNFDLKGTLDDGKIADDAKSTSTTGKPKLDVKEQDDDKIDEDDADDDADDDDDDDADDEADDDAGEDYDDDDDEDDSDIDLKVNIIDKTDKKPEPLPAKQDKQDEEVKLKIKLLENDSLYDDLAPEPYDEAITIEEEHGHYEYLWPLLLAILGALVLLLIVAKLVMVLCSKKNKQVRYNSAIIAAMSHPGRTKKDCGLVYQQLSEELTGPKTPKLNRYAPLHTITVKASNMSYESSPFHHNNIVPESV